MGETESNESSDARRAHILHPRTQFLRGTSWLSLNVLNLAPPKASLAPYHALVQYSNPISASPKPPASLLARSSVLYHEERLATSSSRHPGTGNLPFDKKKSRLYLCESNILGLLSEALTADVQAVFSDETGAMGADAAVKKESYQLPSP